MTLLRDDTSVLALYGDPSGRWVFLAAPAGLITPPAVVLRTPVGGDRFELQFLGETKEIFASIMVAMDRDGVTSRQAAETVAELFGITTRKAADYLSGRVRARLNQDQVSALVCLYFTVQQRPESGAGSYVPSQPAGTVQREGH